MKTDPRELIANSPMSRFQVLIVAIMVGLNALDGFDVLSIAFASPGIAAEWGVERTALGLVLMMELLGMAIGSIVLGGVADKIGRRPTVLGCLVVMAVGMFMATRVTGVVDLSIWRIVTGLGIGGVLAAINAVTAEFSSAKRRHLSISIMVIGYPLGAYFGGLVASQLLQIYGDWRSVFYLGAAVTLLFIPITYFFVPESVQWLARKQPAGALDRINHTLRRMGHEPLRELPPVSQDAQKASLGEIFSPGLLGVTAIVTVAYFLHITTFYFILKWVPPLVVQEFGFEAPVAAEVLAWANLGGAAGGALLGFLTLRYSVKGLTIAVLILSAVMVTVFGRTPESVSFQTLALICAGAGFACNAAIAGLYAIFAQVFPTRVRAFGTGFAIGTGRGGAMLGPAVAGFLLDPAKGGMALPTVAFIMAIGSLLSAGVLLLLKLERERPATQSTAVGTPSPSRAPA